MFRKSFFFLLLTSVFLFACSSNKNSVSKPIKGDNDIEGKVLAGYQGWFNAAGDASGLGWKHYSNKEGFKPGSTNIDFWPDLTEYSKNHKLQNSF